MRRTLLAAIALVATFMTVTDGASAADARASCLGVGSSANAGYPRDRAVISHDVKVIADALGVSPGALIAGSAQQHLGSPEACFTE